MFREEYLCTPTNPNFNSQYSYSPTVLGRVGLDHECEANAGNFSPRGQTNMRKLRLSLSNLRKILNIVKFRRAYALERDHYFTQQRKFCSLLLRKAAIVTIIILMRRVNGLETKISRTFLDFLYLGHEFFVILGHGT